MLTEGVLTRRLQHDPELPGVAAILFDEVHERNLTTDLGLALALDAAATLRPDLRVRGDVGHRRHRPSSPGCSPSTTHRRRCCERRADCTRSTIRWRPRQRADRLERAAASAVEVALRDEPGDVLVFLPGIAEITRTAELLDRVGPGRGRRAPARRRPGRSTSRTSRWPRRHRAAAASCSPPTSPRRRSPSRACASWSTAVWPARRATTPGTGMTRLDTVAISRDSAEQRAGRAGRTEPGVALPAVDRASSTAPARPTARRRSPRSTSAGLALELAAWGTPPERAALRRPAPARTWRSRVDLLHVARGDRAGGDAERAPRLTDVGRAMVPLPLHPRLARIVAGAPLTPACVVAAIVDERDVLRSRTDDAARPTSPSAWRSCAGTPATTVPIGRRRASGARPGRRHRPARRLPVRPRLGRPRPHRAAAARRLPGPARRPPPPRAVPAAHRRRGVGRRRRPAGDRAVRRRRRSRRQAVAARGSVSARRSRRTRSPACSTTSSSTSAWSGTAIATTSSSRVERRLDALRLDEEVRPAGPGRRRRRRHSSPGCARRRLAALDWTPAAVQLRARVGLLRATLGDEWPDLVRRRAAAHARRLAGTVPRGRHVDPRRRPASTWRRCCGAACRGRSARELDELAPPSWTLPTGRAVPIDYAADRPTAVGAGAGRVRHHERTRAWRADGCR